MELFVPRGEAIAGTLQFATAGFPNWVSVLAGSVFIRPITDAVDKSLKLKIVFLLLG
jgi:hypothetical protein